jgi:hypothetical protein
MHLVGYRGEPVTSMSKSGKQGLSLTHSGILSAWYIVVAIAVVMIASA